MKSRDHSSAEEAESPPQSEYAAAVTRVAVAQICGTVGYGAAEASALAVLTDVAGLYLRAIAKSAASSANAHCRTEANLVDVIASLEELNSAQGFEGASNATRDALSSSLVRELERFVKYTEETPFAKPLPRNAFSRKKIKPPKRGGGAVDQYNDGRFRHVPKWLPPMPEIEKEEKEEEKLGFGMVSKEEKESELESESKLKHNRVEREGKCKELPMKRIKVKFKLSKKNQIEQSTRNAAGVCINGIGKRVSCENHGDDEKKEKKKKKSSKMAKSMINRNKLRLSRPSDNMILP